MGTICVKSKKTETGPHELLDQSRSQKVEITPDKIHHEREDQQLNSIMAKHEPNDVSFTNKALFSNSPKPNEGLDPLPTQ